jgi:hypothetical protein
LPFLSWRAGESRSVGLYLVAALYFAAAVPLSYLSYLDPQNVREYPVVHLMEYVPTYVLLFIAAWSAKPGTRGRFEG